MPQHQEHNHPLGEQTLKVKAAGQTWLLARPADLETLWNAISDADVTPQEFIDDERLPYWVEIWPSSLVLADWLRDHASEISGKTCLDLGCGLGLTALVAARAGARVLAMDYEPEALRFASRNAALNLVSPPPAWSVMDWRRPAVKAASFDFIWGGDIMYERRFVDPVLAFLGHALKPGGRAWMAEPGREVYAHFRSALATRKRLGRPWNSAKVHSAQVEALTEQKVKPGINLWELS